MATNNNIYFGEEFSKPEMKCIIKKNILKFLNDGKRRILKFEMENFIDKIH